MCSVNPPGKVTELNSVSGAQGWCPWNSARTCGSVPGERSTEPRGPMSIAICRNKPHYFATIGFSPFPSIAVLSLPSRINSFNSLDLSSFSAWVSSRASSRRRLVIVEQSERAGIPKPLLSDQASLQIASWRILNRVFSSRSFEGKR